MKYNPERARRAVQFLVDSPYFHHHVVKLRGALRRPRSLPFKGEAEPLNELLVIGRQNADALENLIEVAESRRSNRNDYQRDYMAKKRERERHAVELEEALSGEPLSLEARVDVVRRYSHAWNARKAAFLAKHGDLPWLERNKLIRDFWEEVNAELVARLSTAKPVRRHRRTIVLERPRPFNGKLYDALRDQCRSTGPH